MQRNVHFGLRGLDRNFANGCVWMHTAKTTPNQNRPKSSELSISLSLSHSFLVCMMRRTPTTWLIFHHQWSLLSEEYRFLVFCLHSLFIWRDRVGACLNSRKQQQSHHRKHAHTAEPGDNRVAVADRWSPSHGYGWAFSVYENWYLFVVYMRVSARAHVYLTCVNVCLLMDCWLLVRCNSFFFVASLLHKVYSVTFLFSAWSRMCVRMLGVVCVPFPYSLFADWTEISEKFK